MDGFVRQPPVVGPPDLDQNLESPICHRHDFPICFGALRPRFASGYQDCVLRVAHFWGIRSRTRHAGRTPTQKTVRKSTRKFENRPERRFENRPERRKANAKRYALARAKLSMTCRCCVGVASTFHRYSIRTSTARPSNIDRPSDEMSACHRNIV